MFTNAIISKQAKIIVDGSLLDLLCELDSAEAPQEIQAAAHHAAMLDNRRLMSRICLAAFEACGGEATTGAVRVACALELAHAALLAHHDLPALDNIDQRFGCPAVHVAYSDSAAIQAGDTLLADSFAVIAAAQVDCPELRSHMLHILASTLAGSYRNPTGAAIASQTLSELSRNSSPAAAHLYGAAAGLGALAAGEKKIGSWCAFGEAIGAAFQMSDDIRDIALDGSQRARVGGDDRSATDAHASSSSQFVSVSDALAALQTQADQAILLVPACIGYDELIGVIQQAVHMSLPEHLWAKAA